MKTSILCCQQQFDMLLGAFWRAADVTNRDHPYSPQLALDVTGITPQTLRHWRAVLPPLKGRLGRKPCYSAGDLLALKVLDTWAHGLDAKVSRLESSSASLFALCADEPWARIEQSLVLLDLETEAWRLVGVNLNTRCPRGAIVLPIGDYARDLSDRLIGGRRTTQKALDFPLMQVAEQTARRTAKAGAQ